MWGDGSSGRGDRLRDQLLAMAPLLTDAGARAVTVNVHDALAAQAPSPVPTPEGEDPHVAEVSIWVDSYDRRASFEKPLFDVGLVIAGYLVVESLYEDYGTTPHSRPGTGMTVSVPPGCSPCRSSIGPWTSTTRPGSSAGTAPSRRSRANSSPRCRYVRNEVVRPLTDAAPEIHGIVEEAWPSAQHVADPMLFFNARDDPRCCRSTSQPCSTASTSASTLLASATRP